MTFYDTASTTLLFVSIILMYHAWVEAKGRIFKSQPRTMRLYGVGVLMLAISNMLDGHSVIASAFMALFMAAIIMSLWKLVKILFNFPEFDEKKKGRKNEQKKD